MGDHDQHSISALARPVVQQGEVIIGKEYSGEMKSVARLLE